MDDNYLEIFSADKEFFTAIDLFNLGLYGTKFAARQALNKGELPFIQISPRRRVIAKIVLINFLKTKFSEANW